MSMKTPKSFIVVIFLTSLLLSCNEESTVQPVATPDSVQPEITVINEGMDSWIFTDVKGSVVSASLNEPNAQITLKIGERYRFFNLGGPTHPLDFRDSDGNLLLTQDDEKGIFEENQDVDFEINLDDDLVAFTLTQELADVLATYNCSVHTVMEGQINIID